MEYVNISPSDITAIKRGLVDEIKQAGLVLIPVEDADLLLALNKDRVRVMRRNHVSTNTIEKYRLIHKIKTRQSVVNMCKRGDLKENEDWFFDASGNYQILTSAIRRINGE